MAARGDNLMSWLRSFRPRSLNYRGVDYLRGALGAFAGIIVASYAGRAFDIGPAALPYIVAPMGPRPSCCSPPRPARSPNRGRWSVVGGNLSSTLIGVAAGRIFDDTAVAASAAVAVAIATMMLLRCAHPPGGACALFAAVGAPAVHQQGFGFALFPVAVNTIFLLVIAIAVNNLTGRRYPHVAAPAAVTTGTDPVPTRRLGMRSTDIREAMARLDQGLDILPDDVVALLGNAETRSSTPSVGSSGSSRSSTCSASAWPTSIRPAR